MSIRQTRKLYVLEEVTCGRMNNREASAALALSMRQVQRIKANFKEADLKNPFSHKKSRKRKRRIRMERSGQMLQIDASPFDWLSNGSMISLHGAIDDATGNVTALRFERTECLDGYFRVLEETILSS